MAVTPASRPILDGLRPVRGSIRLLALRWALVVVASLPALVVGASGVAGGAARMPYYTEVSERLPLVHLGRLVLDLPPSIVPALVLSVLLAVIGDQVLTGGALALLDPARASEDGRMSVFAAVCREGLTRVFAFLRVAALGLVFSALGVALIRALFNRIAIAGARSGWTGATMVMTLPVLNMALMLLWIAAVGAWVFWCRLITAADGRTRVRRTGLLALRVLWRSPLRSLTMFVALTIGSTLASGAVLFAWRQAEPRSEGGVALWAFGWLLTLGVQAFVWLWLVRSGRLLYASELYADVRARPDDPFKLFTRLPRRGKAALVAPKSKSTRTSTSAGEKALPSAPSPPSAGPGAAA